MRHIAPRLCLIAAPGNPQTSTNTPNPEASTPMNRHTQSPAESSVRSSLSTPPRPAHSHGALDKTVGKIFLGLLAGAAIAHPTSAVSTPVTVAAFSIQHPLDNLDGRELVRRAVERDEALRHGHMALLHDEEKTIERFDASGILLSTLTKHQPGAGQNESLGATDTLREDHDAKGKPSVAAAENSGNFAAVVDLRKLARRFELRREPDGTTDDGRPCYIVRFEPQAGEQGDETREGRVINQLSGRFWLAKDDLSIAQSEGSLTHAVPVAWVASVYRLSFRYRTQLLPGSNLTVPASFILDLGVKAPFYHARERQTTTMRAFRKGA